MPAPAWMWEGVSASEQVSSDGRQMPITLGTGVGGPCEPRVQGSLSDVWGLGLEGAVQ